MGIIVAQRLCLVILILFWANVAELYVLIVITRTVSSSEVLAAVNLLMPLKVDHSVSCIYTDRAVR
jgi:hypothetical protein